MGKKHAKKLAQLQQSEADPSVEQVAAEENKVVPPTEKPGSDTDDSDGPDDDDHDDVGFDGEQRFDFTLAIPSEEALDAVTTFVDSSLYDNFVEKSTGSHIYVDRESMFKALLESPVTSLIQIDQEDGQTPGEDDNSHDAAGEGEFTTGIDNDEDFFGLLSVLDVGRRSENHLALKQILGLLERSPVAVLQAGYSAAALLRATESDKASPSSALLLVNEHLMNVPPEIATQQLLFTLQSTVENLGDEKIHGVLNADPEQCALIVMAKIQRHGGKVADEEQDEPAKKKQRLEGGKKKTTAPAFDLSEFAFLQEEDEFLFQARSERISAVVHKHQPQYDQQPEHEVPHCVVFGVMLDEAIELLESCVNEEQ